MSGYETEHNIPQHSSTQPPRQRPDHSTFWSTAHQLDDTRNNTPTQPHPVQLSAMHRQLANTYQVQLGETLGVNSDDYAANAPINEEMLRGMIATLMEDADDPPNHSRGVPEDWMANLDRVDKKELQRRAESRKDTGDACPICAVPFLEDKYPLVVRLPCHKEHLFDLECIQPWLRLNVTCPLDRKALVKVETEKERIERIVGRGKSKQDDQEEEDDMEGMYG